MKQQMQINTGHSDHKYTRVMIALICLFFGLLWLVLFRPQPPTWDGAFYYTYARSLAFDGDFNLVNDIVLSYPTGGEQYASKGFENRLTSTGHLDNVFAPGTGLFWVPWLLVTRTILTPSSTSPLTGYEWSFTYGAAFISAILVLVALLLLFRRMRLAFGNMAAFIAVMTLMIATPLVHYQFRDGFYSHAASALTTTASVLLWWRLYRTQPRPAAYAILGASIGLAMLVRTQLVIYLILPALSVAWWVWQESDRKKALRQGIVALAAAGLGALAVFAFQMILWKLYYDSWITIPQGDTFMDWRAPWIWPTLVSTYRGIVPWMPVVVLSIAGLILLLKYDARLALPLLLVFLLELYVNGSTRDWFGGGGFGPRRFTSELAILTIGYAALLWRMSSRLRIVFGGVAFVLMGLHQFILVRFGLSDKIGGYLTSMSPTFNWVDTNWMEFGRVLLSYGRGIIREPSDLFILHGSRLDEWSRNSETISAELAIVFAISCLTGLFLVAVIALERRSNQ
jgi:hypothetical protein